MRKIWMAVPAAALAVACSAGAQNAGARAERSFPVGTFQAVSLAGPYDVIVTVGGAPSVRAEGDAELIERLDIRVEDGALEVGARRNGGFRIGRQRGSVTVHVTVPSLTAASIGGSGDMRIDRVEGERFDGSIGGSGDMEIGRLRVGEARFAIAGSGNIRASGTAGRGRISVAGSGDVDLSGVETRSAAISIVGSGNVRTRASETAEVSIMGSGDVEVAGTARCSVNRMGSGEVRCGT